MTVRMSYSKYAIFIIASHTSRGKQSAVREYFMIISKFNGTSTPKGSYSAKTGDSTRKECYGSTVWELHCLRTAQCESIRYKAKSEQNVRQDMIPGVRHGEAALKNRKCSHGWSDARIWR